MKRTTLTAEQIAWLAGTFARNRARFGGWSMEAADPDDGAGGGGNEPDDDAGADGGGRGFPADTPVKDMTPDQRAAYWEHQSRKHETRNKDILKITGGKYGDDLAQMFSELEALRDEKRTDGEKAIEEARKAAREEAARDFGSRMAKLAFETALAHIENDDERAELIDALNLTSVLTDEGDVDTAKVRSIVQKIAPADKGQGNQRPDFGAGRRGAQNTKTGVDAGREMYRAGRKKHTTNDS